MLLLRVLQISTRCLLYTFTRSLITLSEVGKTPGKIMRELGRSARYFLITEYKARAEVVGSAPLHFRSLVPTARTISVKSTKSSDCGRFSILGQNVLAPGRALKESPFPFQISIHHYNSSPPKGDQPVSSLDSRATTLCSNCSTLSSPSLTRASNSLICLWVTSP